MIEIQKEHAEKMLYLGDLHSELKDFRIANLAYNQILQLNLNSEIILNHKVKAHLGLANIAFINKKKKDAKKHIEDALKTGPQYKGSKFYFLYDRAKELYQKYSHNSIPKLVEESTKVFPLFLQPFVELIGYYKIGYYNKQIKNNGQIKTRDNLENLLNKQRVALSRMATNFNYFETEQTEKKQFRDITNFLAMEYFDSVKNVKNEEKIANDRWKWDFEINGWIKVNEPFQTQLHITAYENPNSIKGEYLVKPKKITTNVDGKSISYFFELNDVIIKPLTKKDKIENCTHAETINSHLEYAISTYYNRRLIKSKKDNLIEFLTENKLIKKKKTQEESDKTN